MGVSEQRQERTNGKVEERRETKKLKNGKVVTYLCAHREASIWFRESERLLLLN
jgi:uncharacterized protein YlaI